MKTKHKKLVIAENEFLFCCRLIMLRFFMLFYFFHFIRLQHQNTKSSHTVGVSEQFSL